VKGIVVILKSTGVFLQDGGRDPVLTVTHLG
jgi:hypothetical protein